ncbi:hypothetical protein N9Q18_01000 [bacterium]|nr:hypothetical protein [bacterium]
MEFDDLPSGQVVGQSVCRKSEADCTVGFFIDKQRTETFLVPKGFGEVTGGFKDLLFHRSYRQPESSGPQYGLKYEDPFALFSTRVWLVYPSVDREVWGVSHEDCQGCVC